MICLIKLYYKRGISPKSALPKILLLKGQQVTGPVVIARRPGDVKLVGPL